MSTGGQEGGTTATSASAADPLESWVVVALLVVVAALMVAIACWLWRSCMAIRRDATEGGGTTQLPQPQPQQQQLSAEEERKLLEAVGVPGACVVDVGGAMLCQPPPPPPDHPYENLETPTVQELGLPEYENARTMPPWLQLLFSSSRRGLPVPRPPPRPSRSRNAAQVSNLYTRGGDRAGLLQQQGQHQLVGAAAQPHSGLPADEMGVFRAEPVATSTPQSSAGSSPETQGLERATRVSRPPAGLSPSPYYLLERVERVSVSARRKAARQHSEQEHGASLLPPRAGHHRFTPSWTLRGSSTNDGEHEYEGVQQDVPMGLVTPIRRESPPTGQQLAATPPGRHPRWEGRPPARSAHPPGDLVWEKPPAAPVADTEGVHTLQRHPLQVRREPAGTTVQTVPRQRSHTSSASRRVKHTSSTTTSSSSSRRVKHTSSTTSSSSSSRRVKPPRPLPRTSLGQPRGAASSVQLAVDVHPVPQPSSLARSSKTLLSAPSSQPRE